MSRFVSESFEAVVAEMIENLKEPDRQMPEPTAASVRGSS
jgi:hypothetical protein